MNGLATIGAANYTSGDTVYYYLAAVDVVGNFAYRGTTGTTGNEETARTAAFSFAALSDAVVLTTPDDVTFTAGTTGHILRWTPTDNFTTTPTYTISVDDQALANHTAVG